MNYINLSKEISYALRHNPDAYDLNMDEEGFVSIEVLLTSLNKKQKYERLVTKEDILKVMQYQIRKD